jgi:hypothetical protein
MPFVTGSDISACNFTPFRYGIQRHGGVPETLYSALEFSPEKRIIRRMFRCSTVAALPCGLQPKHQYGW